MNKYQLAALSLAGRSFGRQLMMERLLTLEWGWDDEEEHKGDPIEDEAERKRYYRFLNPDSAMTSFGNAGKFTAFIYSSATNTLFCQSGSMYHGEGLDDYGDGSGNELRMAKKEPKNSRFLFGRFGKTPRGGGFVTVWKTSDQVHDHETEHRTKDRSDGYDPDYDENSYYGLKLGNITVLKKMLSSMVQGSARIVGECPADYPIKSNYVYTDGDGVVEVVGELVGMQGEDMPPGDNTCSQIAKLNVGGREMSFGTALGNLHMVKGQQLDYIKNAICSDYSRLKTELEKNGCSAQLSTLGDMISRVSCPKSDREEWDKLKQQGGHYYRMDLKKIFSDPERVDTEFRGRQKDIDAAFDFAYGYSPPSYAPKPAAPAKRYPSFESPTRKEHCGSYGYYVKMLMESRG